MCVEEGSYQCNLTPVLYDTCFLGMQIIQKVLIVALIHVHSTFTIYKQYRNQTETETDVIYR